MGNSLTDVELIDVQMPARAASDLGGAIAAGTSIQSLSISGLALGEGGLPNLLVRRCPPAAAHARAPHISTAARLPLIPLALHSL